MQNSSFTEFESEAERIRTLRKYDILDTPPDGSFDNIARLAARLLKVPIAIISLVDTDRIWFKSAVGLNTEQIDREPGLCASAILQDEPYTVENAMTDSRSLANPLVAGEFGLRFYAAAPIKVREGFNLGTLCVIDKEPRILDEDGKEVLKDLAAAVVDQLELRLEARKANERQNQLLSIIAHELKNSLALIPPCAEMINKAGKEDLTIGQAVNHIRRAADRMDNLIKQMLEMAQLQAGQVELKKYDLDFSSIISHVVAINVVLANAKHQQLIFELQNHVMIHADESRISEVIDNLVSNAIKYSPRGSTIHINLRMHNNMAIVQVIDQGPGFTDEDKLKIFMPFIKLSARPTAGENSTGIGLFIVKTLVEAHDGIVKAENNPGNTGATFTVEIPAIVQN